MKHRLLGNKYDRRYATWCHNAVQIPSPIAHQSTFHSARFTCEHTYMFLCEDIRSFKHFPIMLANSIARQLITGTVIPFHINNAVAQLHQNGELRSAELFDVFLMDQVLPHVSPVFSQKPVIFFIFSVNFPLSTSLGWLTWTCMDASSISRISSSVAEFSA